MKKYYLLLLFFISLVIHSQTVDGTGAKPIEIVKPHAIEISGTPVHTTGFGVHDGGIEDFAIKGGTLLPDHTYQLDWKLDGVDFTMTNISLLGAGKYVVKVTDSNNCSTTSAEFVIQQPEKLLVSISDPDLITCFGRSTGTLTANPSKGYPIGDASTVRDYYYDWYKLNELGVYESINQYSQTAEGLAEGNYKVIIEDGKQNTESAIKYLGQNKLITVTQNITHVKCRGANTGAVSLAIINGTGSYNVSWTNGPTTADRSGLTAGDYEYTVTDKTVTDCSITGTVTITEPDFDLAINLTAQTQPTTTLSSDGTITITASGGTSPYTYQWTKGPDAYTPNTDPATGITTGLSNGTYKVVAIDGNNCTAESAEIVLDALGVKVDTYTTIKCFGEATGSIQVTAFGGKGTGYTYEWFKVEDDGTLTPQTSTTSLITNLTFGMYKVVVWDGENPSVFINQYLKQPDDELTVSYNRTNVNCAGGQDGTAAIIVSGGTSKSDGTYNYIWEKDGTVLTSILTNSNAALEAGAYKVTVVDDNSCQKSVTFSITVPNPIVIGTPTIKKVLIYGQDTGEIAMPEATEGNGGYSYKWTYEFDSSFLKTTKDISGLKAGKYTLEVSDANVNATTNNAGCITEASFTVPQNPELIVDVQETKFIKCNGDFNGEITALVSGGVPEYHYAWYNSKDEIIGGDTNKITGLGTEDYRVVVTDFYGAEKTSAVLPLAEPGKLIVTATSQTNVLCYGAATGEIKISITGGTAQYTQEWTKDGVSYTGDLDKLEAGIYNVIVKDAVGHDCTATLDQPIVITQPAAPLQVVSANTINLKGFETKDGSIEVTVSGGKPNYTYEWSKDGDPAVIGTDYLIQNLSAGIYHLNIKDANDCTLPQIDYPVTQPDKLEVVSLTQASNTDIACNGDLNAKYSIVIKGGVKEYIFEWLNTTTGVKFASDKENVDDTTISTAANLGAGSYVVSVKDVNSNTLYGINTFTISQPDKLAFTYTTQNVSCFEGNNGIINLNITGGVKSTDLAKPYTIVSGSGTIDSENGIISGLTKGTYQVIISDANGCQTQAQYIEITEPLNSLHITSETITPVTGFELSTGKIVITAAGGTAGYTYLWKDSLGNPVGTDSPTLNNIPADTYTLLITDAKGCTAGNTYIVEQPTKPVLAETHLQAKCNGLLGSLNATATGGAAYNQNPSDRIYTYQLKNKVTGNTKTIIDNTASFINIPDGEYTLKTTDIGGIESSSIDIVFLQPTPVVVSLASKLNVSCFGGQDGAIAVSVTGGTPFIINNAPVYNYQWKKKNTATNLYENFTPASLETLTEGIYAVEVRDANYNVNDASHCVAFLDNIVITQPADFGFEVDKITYINPTVANGNDGALHFVIKGGKTNYEYKLYTKNALGNETVLKTISNTAAKTVDFTNLTKDHYFVSVQDDTGCIKYTDFDFTDNPLLINISQTQNISCFEANNGILKAVVNGGFGIKTISWYRNNVLIPNENNAVLLNVKIGTYYAVVKDSKAVEVTTTPLTVTQPNLVTFTTTKEPVKCLGDSNGTITLTAAGGNGTFRYRYFSSGTLIKDWTNFANGTTTVITALADGDYNIQVQDTQQCTSTDAVVKITSPTALTISSTVSVPATGKALSNGSIAVTAQGANGSYTYKWFKSDNTAINQTTAKAINLAAGKYYIVITDAKGCSLTSPLIEVIEPPLLETTISVQSVVLCNADKNGSLKPATIGGFLKPGENYTYKWYQNGNPTPLATSTILNGIGKGSYYVTATDSNGNQATSTVLAVTEPEVLDNVLTSDYVLCGDFNDWTINATPSGGTKPYNYAWNTGAKTASIQNVKPGNYSVTVTDTHGCNIVKAITIKAPAHLDAAEVIKIPTCYEGSDATIVVTPIAGTAPYKYLWNTGEKTNTLSNASAGDYTVEITDARGCVISRPYAIVNPPKDVIDLGEDVTLCFDQTLTINAAINDDKATYFWTSDKGFTSNKAMITVSEPADYTVVVTNKLGCKATDTIKISSQQTAISAEFAVSSQVFRNEKIIIVDISNPAPDTVEWIIPNNATIISKDSDYAEISFSDPGEYDITLNTTKGNCTASQTKSVLVTEGEFEENNPDEEVKNFDLKIFPNPSAGNFTVDVTLDKIMPAHVKVYSLSNNVLIDSKTENGKMNYQFNFSLTGLPTGIYFVLFESQQGSKLRKIIIQ